MTLGGTCTSDEYGDPFTIMGSASTYHHNNWHRAQFGWLAPTTVTTSGTYSLAPAESTSTAVPRLLRIPRGDGTFLNLELRQPGGTFETFSSASAVANGVSVRIAPELTSSSNRSCWMRRLARPRFRSALAAGRASPTRSQT